MVGIKAECRAALEARFSTSRIIRIWLAKSFSPDARAPPLARPMTDPVPSRRRAGRSRCGRVQSVRRGEDQPSARRLVARDGLMPRSALPERRVGEASTAVQVGGWIDAPIQTGLISLSRPRSMSRAP